ncbi:ferrous iron transport protein B [Amedibacillus dolichus]|uniref:ferrous iron transport protein B n=1 Tax=Amedibacillus dolichus TaxID=31971 RepID=UPI002943AE7A|nr:ferrous iron transport protein B [Amedibacillus dolichus]
MREVLIALAGNQNSGKTTLFNRLTGSNQHVGNFPGVTVERKEGTIKSYKEATLVDLPGIYSFSPYTSEEVVTRDFILEGHPDVLINIVDATNIERNLYLSLQLLELEIPMVIALNMMDEVNASGNSIDVKKLSDKLGVPVVPISAGKNEGIFDLIDTLKKTVREIKPKQSDDEVLKMPQFDFCSGEVHRAIHAIAHIVEDHARRLQYPLRFTATKLVEGDELIEQALALHQDDRDIIDKIVQSMEQALGLDREAALADMRYTYIEQLVKECVVKRNETLAHVRSEKLDRIFTHKYLGIPVFIMIMLAVFYLTFGPIGGTLKALMEEGVGYVIDALSAFLVSVGVSDWLHALIIDGICNGVGSVVSFLPLIVVLFFFLSLLEDSGYMARVAFVMDKALRKIGLSGKSFVPMLIGFGCSVPAIMSARTLSSERDRKMTIIVTPFMSCSAKLPIYGMITAAFFPEHTALVLIAVYGLGILVAIVSALLLKRTVFQGEPIPFVLELPNYRIPDARSVVLHMWEKAKDFLVRAFTIIFVASILIWFLQSFDFTLHMVADSGESMLAQLGTWLSHIFAPLGFEDWRASTALVTGITAKESVVSTLSVLTNATSDAGLSAALMNIFTPVSAFAYLCFTVLYMPCVAAFAATKRELGSMKEAMFTALFQTGVAYIVALIVYQLGTLLFM